MKKVLILTLLVTGTFRGFSQSLEDINKLMEKNQFLPAKDAIDKYLGDPKNASSAEGFYYKGRIYNSLSRAGTTSKPDAYTYKIIAFDAFKQNQQLDKMDFRMKSEFYKSYLDLYAGFYDLGAQQFNDKDYTGAYNSFLKASEIENFILSKKYIYEQVKLNTLDTSLILNIATAALQAKDNVNAEMYYRKLTDAGIIGKDYEQIYEFLVSYYNEKKDEVNLQNILSKAKTAYPKNNYWNEMEMERLVKSGDKKAMFAKYEELYVKDPANFGNNYNYAIEMYNYIYKDLKDTDPASKDKLTALLKNAILHDTTIDATSLLTNHLFNAAADLSTSAALIKSTKPDDVKKKKELNTLAIAKMDETIPYAEKLIKHYSSQPKLTTKQKANEMTMLGFLSDIYSAKGNPKKSAEYDKMRSDIKF